MQPVQLSPRRDDSAPKYRTRNGWRKSTNFHRLRLGPWLLFSDDLLIFRWWIGQFGNVAG